MGKCIIACNIIASNIVRNIYYVLRFRRMEVSEQWKDRKGSIRTDKSKLRANKQTMGRKDRQKA
jgi:hypothetical protein